MLGQGYDKDNKAERERNDERRPDRESLTEERGRD